MSVLFRINITNMVPYFAIVCAHLAVLSGIVDSKPLSGIIQHTSARTNNAYGQMKRVARQENRARKQRIIAIPPVTTSILHGPYLPPADADNQIYLAPHGLVNPLHGQHFYPGSHFPHDYYPPHMGHYGLGHYQGAQEMPFGYHYHGYHDDIPFGIRHQYHTHWPHMHAAGPVFAGDPNDGLYQDPLTGTLIPRPIMSQHYPVMMNPGGNLVGEDGPGVMFLGTGRNAIPVRHSDVENSIIDRHENRHDSPIAEVADEMDREITEAAQEKHIQQTALAQKHHLMKVLKLGPKK